MLSSASAGGSGVAATDAAFGGRDRGCGSTRGCADGASGGLAAGDVDNGGGGDGFGTSGGGGAGSAGAPGSGGVVYAGRAGGAGSPDSGSGAGASDADARQPTCSVGTSCTPDGSFDSGDMCPNDPSKISPGQCGCGTADIDSDHDRVADCVDRCPTDSDKAAPGLCGCGAADPPAGGGAAFCLKALLTHRYGFTGSGTMVTDSVGTAHGVVHGGASATLSGGALSLAGNLAAGYANEGYASLPPNVLTGLTDATIEAWVIWRGAAATEGAPWQRVFDFGDQLPSSGSLVGNTYFFLTPSSESAPARLLVTYSANGKAGEVVLGGTQPLPIGVTKHIAVTFDDSRNTLALYLDGVSLGSRAITGRLSAIRDVNPWLGRSNYQNDPELNGSLLEFRIYKVALTAAQVRTSYDAGTDPVDLL